MEITIVEPCPECGTVPNKFTETKDPNGYLLRIECPNCGWTSNNTDFEAGFALRKWNESASNRRIEKAAKPCPFCSSISLVLDYDNDSYFVVCTHCGCRTANCNTKENALNAWNRRPNDN